jgi:DtxR family Mn-dependent transcriptional regulator
VARAKDIADRLGVQRGSVTGALKNLEEKGFINYAPYSFITLTKEGKRVAKSIAYRHAVLKDFLLNILQIDLETAENTACSMEHVIDAQTLERLVCFIDYIHKCPRTGEDWIKAFVNYCTSGDWGQEKCDQCIDTCMTLYQKDKD